MTRSKFLATVFLAPFAAVAKSIMPKQHRARTAFNKRMNAMHSLMDVQEAKRRALDQMIAYRLTPVGELDVRPHPSEPALIVTANVPMDQAVALCRRHGQPGYALLPSCKKLTLWSMAYSVKSLSEPWQFPSAA